VKAILRWTVTAGLGLATGIAGVGHTATTPPPETALAITIHVRNYAGVAAHTLEDAERAATAIFRKAGVEIAWDEMSLPAEHLPATPSKRAAFTLGDIRLNIVPEMLVGRSRLPNNALGLAPGTGANRDTIYVFDDNVQSLFWKVLNAHLMGNIDVNISRGLILGHVIAHEVGHLLLDQELHSVRGIMRGQWSFADLRDMARGLLNFTPQQAERMQDDIRSRESIL
jgi:hypothetical protein